jgi:ferredoxin
MAYADNLLERYPDAVTLAPQDEVGLLPLAELLDTPTPDTLVYCCGPEPLLTAVEAACAPWPTGSLHIERFAPKEFIPTSEDTTVEVELAQSGITLTVPPGQSLLTAINDAGIDLPSACTEGICGTCETAVLGGTPDHRDSVLTDAERAENTTMFPCVSRAIGDRLVLDL